MNANVDLAAMQRDWKPPVELSGSGPREVRLSAGGKVLAFVAALMFGGAIASGVGLTRVAARQETERKSLRAAAVEVQAVVTRHWRTGGKSDTPKIAYEFEYAGHTYHGSARAPRRIWGALSVGASIPIRFLPSNPELNHPAEWESDVLPKVMPGIIAASLVLVGLLMVFIIRREMGLLTEARAAPGRVTRVRRVKNGHFLNYEFATLAGEVLKGRAEVRKAQPVGATLCVLYDRDNPRRNAPYPLKLVRVAR
jgi:hypothetical protein